MRTIETDERFGRELTLVLAQMCAGHVWARGSPHLRSMPSSWSPQRVVGDKHLKLAPRSAKRRFEAILFQQTARAAPRIRAAYRPEVNHYQGLDSLQLVIEHWLPV